MACFGIKLISKYIVDPLRWQCFFIHLFWDDIGVGLCVTMFPLHGQILDLCLLQPWYDLLQLLHRSLLPLCTLPSFSRSLCCGFWIDQEWHFPKFVFFHQPCSFSLGSSLLVISVAEKPQSVVSVDSGLLHPNPLFYIALGTLHLEYPVPLMLPLLIFLNPSADSNVLTD